MMAKFFKHSSGVTVPMVAGKFYVMDMYGGPCAGPCSTEDEACNERDKLSIADDCIVGMCEQSNPDENRFRVAGFGVYARETEAATK